MNELLVLLRQRRRRDRFQLAVWIISIGLLTYASTASVAGTYGDEAGRTQILQLAVATRTVLVFRGTPNGPSLGAFVFFELFSWLAVMVGLMSSFLAVRHSRADEELGRAELVASTPAGRILPTVATVVHGLLANVVVGVLVALALIANGLDAAGSFVFGAAVTAVGATCLAFGLFVAQLFRTSRGANGAGVAFVIGAYIMRGIGDAAGTPSDDLLHVTPAWPSWISSIGWGQATGAYVRDDLRPLLLAVVFSAVLVAVVFGLQSVRDQGASLIPGRPGRANAGPLLSSSVGLAWRLNSTVIASWAVGGTVGGLLATSLSSLVDEVGSEAPDVAKVLQGSLGGAASLEQALMATVFGIVGVLACCCVVQIGIRARQEEAHGTAETVLTTPVPRIRWLADYWLVGVLATLIVLACAALAGLVGVGRAADPDALATELVETAIAQIPVALVFLGLTLLVFAYLPRATIPLAWSLVGFLAMLGIFGPLFGVPKWLVNVSPFTHAPVPVGDSVDWTGGLWMIGIGLVTAALAVASMRRRELVTGG